jgi:thioredoxin reductase
VEAFTGAEAREITPQRVKARHNGGTKTFEADTVVLAVGMSPSQELNRKLAGKAPALYSIGDCAEPGMIVNAIHDGARVACEI